MSVHNDPECLNCGGTYEQVGGLKRGLCGYCLPCYEREGGVNLCRECGCAEVEFPGAMYCMACREERVGIQ